jgi:transposase
MEKISWTDCVKNEEVLQRVKEDRNILQRIKRRKANWICHILCSNSLLKHVIEGKLEGRREVMGRRGCYPTCVLYIGWQLRRRLILFN